MFTQAPRSAFSTPSTGQFARPRLPEPARFAVPAGARPGQWASHGTSREAAGEYTHAITLEQRDECWEPQQVWVKQTPHGWMTRGGQILSQLQPLVYSPALWDRLTAVARAQRSAHDSLRSLINSAARVTV